MGCDLGAKLSVEFSPEKVELILHAFQAGAPDMEKLKEKAKNSVAKQGGASIMSLLADLATENLSIGAMDKVEGDNAPQRAQAVAVASSGTSVSLVDEPLTASGMQDYPDSVVELDEAGNWTKVNKKTGQVDWVHNSGSKISFYKNGDVVMHVAANLKQVVENDYILEVGRNFEVTSGKETHITSKEDMYITSEMNLFETTTFVKVQTVPTKVQLSLLTSIISPSWFLLGSETVSNNITSSSHNAGTSAIGSLSAGTFTCPSCHCG